MRCVCVCNWIDLLSFIQCVCATLCVVVQELESEVDTDNDGSYSGGSGEEVEAVVLLAGHVSGDDDDDDDDDDDVYSESDGEDAAPVREHGCKHYARRCRIISPCCSETFDCRLCHDEVKLDGARDVKKVSVWHTLLFFLVAAAISTSPL